jgi:hypothetical protein
VVRKLILTAVTEGKLVEQLTEIYRIKEAVVKKAAHAYRNRVATIGGFKPNSRTI